MSTKSTPHGGGVGSIYNVSKYYMVCPDLHRKVMLASTSNIMGVGNQFTKKTLLGIDISRSGDMQLWTFHGIPSKFL